MRAHPLWLTAGLAGCLVDVHGPYDGFEGDYVAEEVSCPAEPPEDTTAELSIDVHGDDIAFYLSGRGLLELEATTGCVVFDDRLVCGLQDQWECIQTEIGLDCEHFVEDNCIWHFERW